ncbi:cytidine deaminase [Urechidicola sp. KH5]
MKKLQLTTSITVYDDVTELPKDVQQLMNAAIDVRKNAYAPYSQFLVGAALLLDNGTIVTGSNQENAAYPSGLCAERVAVYYAGAQYPDAKILRIAITAGSIHETLTEPVAPCGSCRQSLSEYEKKQNAPMEVYFMGETGKIIKTDTLHDLLPLAFDKTYL